MELGRLGGRSHHRPASVLADLPAKLETLTGVQETISWVVTETLAGRLDPKVADSTTPLLKLQCDVLQTTTLFRRVEELQKMVDAHNLKEHQQAQELSPSAPEPAKPLSYAATNTA